MDIDITGRNIDITDRFRAYATEKSDKVAHLADRALALEIKASRHAEGKGSAGGDRVELTLIGKGPVVRAEASGADKYAAFDVAIGRLLERVRRAKDRKKVHRGQHRPTSLRDAAADDFSVVAIQPADAAVLEQLSEEYGVPYVVTSDLDLAYLDDRLHLTDGGHRTFGAAVAERVAAVEPSRPAVLVP